MSWVITGTDCIPELSPSIMLSLAIAVESGQSSVRVSPIGPLGCANWYTDGSYFFDGREDVIWTGVADECNVFEHILV